MKRGKLNLTLGFAVGEAKKAAAPRASKATKASAARDRGSPSRSTSRRTPKTPREPELAGFVVPDEESDPYEQVDDDEEDSLGFAPIREGLPRNRTAASASSTRTVKTTTTKTTTKAKEPKVGAPITKDKLLADLNPYDYDLVLRFEREAKTFRNEVPPLPPYAQAS